MSEDINIASPTRTVLMAAESLEGGGKVLADTDITNSDSPDQIHSDGGASNMSPRQQTKKRKNKRKKSNKATIADINEDSKIRGKEGIDTKMAPKDGKTKENMERQKQMATSQVKEENADEKIEVEMSEAEGDVNKEEDDCLDMPPADQLDGNARNRLYQQGLEYINKDKKKTALKCFMACLTGLADKEGFAFLPQCLKHMADIYYSQEEYEKAIQFIQAEKMYYETALINTSGLQKKLEENMTEKNGSLEGSREEGVVTSEPKDPEVLRADEYENLARLCLSKQQAELALEYQGKATKLWQQHYGADHPLTKKSLDFFTVVYAEVGKQQYTESLQKFSEEPSGGSSKSETPPGGDTELQLSRRKLSGIMRTSNQLEDSTKHKDRHVRFEEPEQIVRNRERREEEEWISQSIMLVLFGLCIIMLTCMLFYLYCRLDPRSHTCVSWKSQLHYYYMQIKYLYYTWNPNSNNKFG